jgi:hypothetical protein
MAVIPMYAKKPLTIESVGGFGPGFGVLALLEEDVVEEVPAAAACAATLAPLCTAARAA